MGTPKRVRVRETMRIISFRLTDQIAWSGGFFLFNMAAAFSFSVDSYAAVATACSIGVIVAACVRAYALDGPLVAGAKARVGANESFSAKVVWTSSVIGSAVAGILASLWIWLSTGNAPDWTIAALSMTIVVADAPHYLLTMKRAYSRALRTGSLYLIGGLLAVGFANYLDPIGVMLIWLASTLVCMFTGWLLTDKSAKQDLRFPYRPISRRMAAEALYSALGSQVGILLIYLTSDASVTAGLRLAYSLVFAPVFMVIQGLTPLYLLKMSSLYRRGSNEGRQLSIYWISGSWISVALAGACGFVAITLPVLDKSNLAVTIPYLAPVGLSIMGSICFDAALLVWRFSVSPSFPHRARLGMVAIEIAAQVTGILVAGPSGLVVALISTAALKAAVATFILMKIRDRPAQLDASFDSFVQKG